MVSKVIERGRIRVRPCVQLSPNSACARAAITMHVDFAAVLHDSLTDFLLGLFLRLYAGRFFYAREFFFLSKESRFIRVHCMIISHV